MHPRLPVVEAWAGEHGDLVSAEQARRLGLPRPWPQRLAACGRWERLLRGIYRIRPAEPPTTGQLLAAARLFAGGGLVPLGVVVGRGACRLWGYDGDRGPFRPELIVPPTLRRRQPAGLRYRWDDLSRAGPTTVQGLPVVDAFHALAERVAVSRLGEGVALADAALRLGVVSPDQLHRCSHAALRHADGASESPLESRVRAEIIGAGLPTPALQHVLRDRAGSFVARLDLAWPRRRLAVEADGAETHAGPAALRDDLRRQNAIVALGWTVLRFTWADLGQIAPSIRAALTTREPHAG